MTLRFAHQCSSPDTWLHALALVPDTRHRSVLSLLPFLKPRFLNFLHLPALPAAV